MIKETKIVPPSPTALARLSFSKQTSSLDRMNSRICRPWTGKDDQDLYDMYQENRSYGDMAEKLGRTNRAIRDRLRRLDKTRDLHASRKNPVSPQWSEAEDNLLRELYHKKENWAEISARLGRSVYAAQMRIRRIGVNKGTKDDFPLNHPTPSKPRKRISKAKEVKCLRCRSDFRSWDPTKNRICPTCKMEEDSSVGWMNGSVY